MSSDHADADDEDLGAINGGDAESGEGEAAEASLVDDDDGEYDDDGVNVIRKRWLSLPSAYMKPLQMCAVNQFVHCVRKLDTRFLSTGSEYVLVGTGASMPDHFHQWIYCMHQVIRKSIF